MPFLHFDKIAGNEQSILIQPFKRQSWKKEGGSFDPSPNPRKDNAKQPPIRIESSIRIAKAAARFAPEEWPAKQKGGISIKGFQKRGAITTRIEDVLKQKPRHGYRRARLSSPDNKASKGRCLSINRSCDPRVRSREKVSGLFNLARQFFGQSLDFSLPPLSLFCTIKDF